MTAADLEEGLRTRWLGRPLEVVAETGSTNDDVLARGRGGAPAGLVIFAEAQTRGRGRLGRSWSSPPADNLYFSALLRPGADATQAPPLTLAAGVAVRDVLADLGCGASIKWPNDVLIDGKKVAGILTETSSRGGRMEAIALGIGVNVNGREWPPELEGKATSVRLALGRAVDRAGLARRLLESLESWLDLAMTRGATPVVQALRARSGLLGRRVRVSIDATTWREGVARDFADDGALEIQEDGGEVFRAVSGEVALT